MQDSPDGQRTLPAPVPRTPAPLQRTEDSPGDTQWRGPCRKRTEAQEAGLRMLAPPRLMICSCLMGQRASPALLAEKQLWWF